MVYHMKRATLLLEDELYRRTKALSKKRGVSLKEVINSLLREGLNHIHSGEKAREFKLPLHQGLDPIAGVDIADRGSLYDVMDGRLKR